MEDKEKIAILLEALREIAKCQGRFSLIPLTHCENTIGAMKGLAEEALAKVKDEQ